VKVYYTLPYEGDVNCPEEEGVRLPSILEEKESELRRKNRERIQSFTVGIGISIITPYNC